MNQSVLVRNLKLVKNVLNKLDTLKDEAMVFSNGSEIRDIYRGLRSGSVRNTSTRILVHAENIIFELTALESALRDAEAILLQQAEHNDKRAKTTR